jgi:hypothetical protein
MKAYLESRVAHPARETLALATISRIMIVNPASLGHFGWIFFTIITPAMMAVTGLEKKVIMPISSEWARAVSKLKLGVISRESQITPGEGSCFSGVEVRRTSGGVGSWVSMFFTESFEVIGFCVV